mmetsp:Transcript_16756/g.36300  ORF Transcript_16756/g.36300 Transcript_16756/m.36300 type:complete len:273 (+) Transcript_16756:142-960(+)
MNKGHFISNTKLMFLLLSKFPHQLLHLGEGDCSQYLLSKCHKLSLWHLFVGFLCIFLLEFSLVEGMRIIVPTHTIGISTSKVCTTSVVSIAVVIIISFNIPNKHFRITGTNPPIVDARCFLPSTKFRQKVNANGNQCVQAQKNRRSGADCIRLGKVVTNEKNDESQDREHEVGVYHDGQVSRFIEFLPNAAVLSGDRCRDQEQDEEVYRCRYLPHVARRCAILGYFYHVHLVVVFRFVFGQNHLRMWNGGVHCRPNSEVYANDCDASPHESI